MSDTEDLNVGDFDPSTYQHVLPEGAHDFDDYDSEYVREHPELGFMDEQVEAEVAKLDPEDRKFYEEHRGFLDTNYRQHGKIIEMPDLIKLIMTGCHLRYHQQLEKNKTNCGRSSWSKPENMRCPSRLD